MFIELKKTIHISILLVAAILITACGSVVKIGKNATYFTKNSAKKLINSKTYKKKKGKKKKKKKNGKNHDYYYSDEISRTSDSNSGNKLPDGLRRENALSAEEASASLDSDLPSIDKDLNEIKLEDFKESKYSWKTDIEETIKLSRRYNRPILAYMLYSGSIGTHKQLESEVLNTQDFQDIAEKHDMLLLKLDYSNTNKIDADTKKAQNKFKKFYHAKGYPNVLLFAPNGKEIHRYTGYIRGSSSVFLLVLESKLETATKELTKIKEKLILKGFDDWKTNEDNTVFAKFIKTQKGKAKFQLPDGKISWVPLTNLSNTSLKKVTSKLENKN